MISLFRIDDRLIHAQVVIGWGRVINPDRLVIVNDDIANDNIKADLYISAVPPQYEVSVMSLKEASIYLKAMIYEEEKVIVLFKSPRDVVELLNDGVEIKEVNVGGLHYSEGREKIMNDLYLDQDDRRALLELIERGIRLEVRSLPDKTPVVLNSKDF